MRPQFPTHWARRRVPAPWSVLALAVGVALALAAPASAPAKGQHRAGRAKAPVLTRVSCFPVPKCSADPSVVPPGGRLQIRGRGLAAGMAVVFRRRPGAGRGPLIARLAAKPRWVVRVPGAAASGRIRVVGHGGRRSNLAGPIAVRANTKPSSPGAPATPTGGPSLFDGTVMWIWMIDKSEGGNVQAIVDRARAHGVRTIIVKAADGGSNFFPQFTSGLISTLKAAGINVCGYHYIYGDHPQQEAALSARVVQTGPDCLVLDAEGQYEGKYAAATTYIAQLRGAIGDAYPVALAPFPYVDFHASFPFSVLLGPGGAQYDLPQMYWKAIGTSVDTNFQHTYLYHRIYDRPIYPLGQLYQDPSPSEIVRFRQLANAYGARGVNWWDWQETSARGFNAIDAPLPPLTDFTPDTSYAQLKRGSKGDPVVWLQELLISAGQTVAVTGSFSPETQNALTAFQSAASLPPSGTTDAATWKALLKNAPTHVDWTKEPKPAAYSLRGRAARAPDAPRP